MLDVSNSPIIFRVIGVKAATHPGVITTPVTPTYKNWVPIFVLTWLMLRFGSPVMTVRAEKSTRFPIKFPRTRPSLAFNLSEMDLRGRPDFCMALGTPGSVLSITVTTWNCNIFTSSSITCAAAPDCSLRRSCAFVFTMSHNLCVTSSFNF